MPASRITRCSSRISFLSFATCLSAATLASILYIASCFETLTTGDVTEFPKVDANDQRDNVPELEWRTGVNGGLIQYDAQHVMEEDIVDNLRIWSFNSTSNVRTPRWGENGSMSADWDEDPEFWDENPEFADEYPAANQNPNATTNANTTSPMLTTSVATDVHDRINATSTSEVATVPKTVTTTTQTGSPNELLSSNPDEITAPTSSTILLPSRVRQVTTTTFAATAKTQLPADEALSSTIPAGSTPANANTSILATTTYIGTTQAPLPMPRDPKDMLSTIAPDVGPSGTITKTFTTTTSIRSTTLSPAMSKSSYGSLRSTTIPDWESAPNTTTGDEPLSVGIRTSDADGDSEGIRSDDIPPATTRSTTFQADFADGQKTTEEASLTEIAVAGTSSMLFQSSVATTTMLPLARPATFKVSSTTTSTTTSLFPSDVTAGPLPVGLASFAPTTTVETISWIRPAKLPVVSASVTATTTAEIAVATVSVPSQASTTSSIFEYTSALRSSTFDWTFPQPSAPDETSLVLPTLTLLPKTTENVETSIEDGRLETQNETGLEMPISSGIPRSTTSPAEAIQDLEIAKAVRAERANTDEMFGAEVADQVSWPTTTSTTPLSRLNDASQGIQPRSQPAAADGYDDAADDLTTTSLRMMGGKFRDFQVDEQPNRNADTGPMATVIGIVAGFFTLACCCRIFKALEIAVVEDTIRFPWRPAGHNHNIQMNKSLGKSSLVSGTGHTTICDSDISRFNSEFVLKKSNDFFPAIPSICSNSVSSQSCSTTFLDKYCTQNSYEAGSVSPPSVSHAFAETRIGCVLAELENCSKIQCSCSPTPLYTNGSRVECYSVGKKCWQYGELRVVLWPRSASRKPQVRYDIEIEVETGNRRQVSENVPPDRIRRPLQPDTPVEVFFSDGRGGGRWLPGVVDIEQDHIPTINGYKIQVLRDNADPETFVVDSVRCRHRYIENSIVRIYKGGDEGWVLAKVGQPAEVYSEFSEHAFPFLGPCLPIGHEVTPWFMIPVIEFGENVGRLIPSYLAAQFEFDDNDTLSI